MMQFKGVMFPRLNTPLIELQTTGGETIDLYNNCLLESVSLRGEKLIFVFAWDGNQTPVLVQFDGVRCLRIFQPEGWVPQEASQIDHLLIRSEGPWSGIVFKAGGMEYEFDCSELELSIPQSL